MADLEYLIRRVALKDREAFSLLYKEINKRVYFYILGLVKDETAAQDILADTFIEIWKSAAKFQGRSKAITWILGIARNLSFKFLKKNRTFDDIDDHYELKSNEAESFVDKFANIELVKKGLERLSPKHREVLHLVFFEELPYEEISNLLKIPLNTVKTRVYHAKKALKQELSRED
ncbi:MAG: sigma-70 family RNA polymerase sigma factor [Thermodesulfobacteria bacterium]|nr:sigma-70 family RNA polymerase sigma factor [Thermodesulfobacteriota bacterium]